MKLAPALPTPRLPDIHKCRILVVEDNAMNREMLLALLQRQGFTELAAAHDGGQALAMIDEFQPDLLLLDVMMPVLDGFSLCRRLRGNLRYRDLPILMQTSLDRPQDRVMAFSCGATDLISKPLNPQELLARVRIHLQSRVMIRELTLYRQRTSTDLARARAAQRRLLPEEADIRALAALRGIELDWIYEPSSELGGDHWGVSKDTSGRPVLYLVDFSGHGVMAALNVARLQVMLHQCRFDAASPGAQLAVFNRALCPLLGPGQFATMLLAYIDPQQDRLWYASAGATAPLCWQGQNAISAGDSDGLPLGLSPDARYEDRSLPLPTGGAVLLYSDAAVELQRDSGILGDAGFLHLVEQWRADWPAGLPALAQALRSAGELSDDLTMVWVRRRGEAR